MNPWKTNRWSNQYGMGVYRVGSWNRNKLFRTIDEGKKIDVQKPQSNRYTDDGRIYQIDSTAIHSVDYKDGIASIRFTSDPTKVYTYKATPEEMKKLLDAPSKGHMVATLWNHNPHFHDSLWPTRKK